MIEAEREAEEMRGEQMIEEKREKRRDEKRRSEQSRATLMTDGMPRGTGRGAPDLTEKEQPGEGPGPMQLRVAQGIPPHTARRGRDGVRASADRGLRSRRAGAR